jgi:hypothetical protein
VRFAGGPARPMRASSTSTGSLADAGPTVTRKALLYVPGRHRCGAATRSRSQYTPRALAWRWLLAGRKGW